MHSGAKIRYASSACVYTRGTLHNRHQPPHKHDLKHTLIIR